MCNEEHSTMSSSLRRFATLGCLVAAFASPMVVTSSAGAATPAGIVPSVLNTTYNYLTHVRTYFICGPAKCKKERATLLKSAQTSMIGLSSLAARASKSNVQKKYRESLNLYVTDVNLLATSYQEYFVTKSSVTLSGVVGNIFYLTSDIASDVNVMGSVDKNTPVNFNLWVEGEAATLVAMQTDASALQSSTATASVGIYANQLLEGEAHEMLAHADGPDASFNTMLKAFAHNQLRISQSEILFLQNKKAPMTETQVANLNVTVTAEFAKLIKTESALVKKK